MKLTKIFGKSHLDEMQEHTLLTIESRGFWLIWWLLLAVLLGEWLLGFTMRETLGIFLVFMIGCVYTVAACLRAGIWGRTLNANTGTNVMCSLAGAAVIAVFTFLKMSVYDAPLAILLVCAAIAAGVTFVLTFIMLQLCSAAYRKRHEQLENEMEKEDNEE